MDVMFKKFIKACNVYHKCPEIRHHIRHRCAARIATHLTLLLLSPFLLFSVASLGVAHVLNWAADWVVALPHNIIGWLHQYQQDQVASAHAIVSIEEIQKRIGADINEDI
jgi:hypothetical protein